MKSIPSHFNEPSSQYLKKDFMEGILSQDRKGVKENVPLNQKNFFSVSPKTQSNEAQDLVSSKENSEFQKQKPV